MSLKISVIKNIRNLELDFCDYDSKIGMIYGLNGTGKTTIKKIIESSFSNSKLAKHFEKPKDSSSAVISIDGKEYKYSKTWDKNVSGVSLHIFDNDFVNDNIYIDGKISSGQRPNITKVLYGIDNIKKYKDVEKLSKKIYDSKENYKLELLEFKQSKEYLDIYNLNNHLNRIENILQTSYLFKAGSSKIIESHISKCVNDTLVGRKWLKNGLEHQKDTLQCPMCGQSLSENEIELFNEIDNSELFTIEYTAIKAILTAEILNVEDIVVNTMCKLKIGRKDFILSKLHEVKEEKELDWMSIISLNDNKTLSRLFSQINLTNSIINSMQEKIDKKNIEYLTQESKKLYSKGIYFFKSVTAILDNLNKQQHKHDTIILKIKDNLHKSFSKKIESINNDLHLHGIPYELDADLIKNSVKSSAKKSGAQIEGSLLFKYKGTDIKISERDLGSTLSQGEKSIVAWILFKHDIEEKIGEGSNLIILDDPIASYDEYKRFPMIRSVRNIVNINHMNKVLILTHEKSFVSLYSTQNIGQLYTIQSKRLIKTSLYEILSNELIENVNSIVYINKSGIDYSNVTEFLIRARKLIEFNDALTNDRKGLEGDYKKAFDNLSKLLHCDTKILQQKSLSTIFRLLNQYQTTKIRQNMHISRKPIDLLDVAKSNSASLYSHRIIIEQFLKSLIPKTKYKVFLDKCSKEKSEPVLGRLFEFVKDLKRINKMDQTDISYTLPIVNTVYHNGDIYGLSVKDISDVNISSVQRVVDRLITEL